MDYIKPTIKTVAICLGGIISLSLRASTESEGNIYLQALELEEEEETW